MTLAALAFSPELWAAGIATVGISSLLTFLENTSAYRRRFREVEYGFLDTDRDFLIEASPITRVDDMRAPLMLIHGANDPRVPVGEARQLHELLRERGVESELLVYDDEGHGLAKRVEPARRIPANVRLPVPAPGRLATWVSGGKLALQEGFRLLPAPSPQPRGDETSPRCGCRKHGWRRCARGTRCARVPRTPRGPIRAARR